MSESTTTGGLPRPVLGGRPLLDSRLDMALYLPREPTQTTLWEALSQGLNIVLEGARGAGRTSLLRAVLFEARSASGDTSALRLHYVRAAAARSAADLVRIVAAAVLGSDLTTDHDATDTDTGALALISTLARRLEQAASRPVVCLDDVDPRIGNQLFGVLRDEVWGLPLQWLVTVTPDDAPTLLRPPADAFFERRVDLPPLTSEEAGALIERRLGHPVQVPAGQEAWTPREALDLARLAPQEWDASIAQKARRDIEVAKLGRPATMLVAAMEELGPVSPSDDRLLERTGWTSSRASQVFRQLLDVGLVAYREVRGDRPGRPARLYELRPLRG